MDTPSKPPTDPKHEEQHQDEPQPGTIAAGADPHGKIPSAAEAEDRGDKQRLKDEEAAELDDALEDTFPASDPPQQP